MKTDDLIAALAADKRHLVPEPKRLLVALACAIAAGAVAFSVLLYPRHDFFEAVRTVRFDFKVLIAFAFAVSAFFGLRRAARPETASGSPHVAMLIVPAVLLVAVVIELVVLPSSLWVTRWFGHNWKFCLTFIPILSLGPLAVLLFVLRSGASTAPARTGAVAGLLAGGIGAVFYAVHCPDDSPLFVASWYTIAITAVTALGAVIGARLLRW